MSHIITNTTCCNKHNSTGRYGDPLDPDADLKAMRFLSQIVEPGGRLSSPLPCFFFLYLSDSRLFQPVKTSRPLSFSPSLSLPISLLLFFCILLSASLLCVPVLPLSGMSRVFQILARPLRWLLAPASDLVARAM